MVLGFFSLKITVEQVQPPLVKMKKFGRTGQISKEPFSRLEVGKKFAIAFHRTPDSG